MRNRFIYRGHVRLWHLLCASLLAAMLLSGCTPAITRYEGQLPKLDLRQYFSGKVRAWGMVQDYRGAVTRRFTVDIDCRWQGDTGTLDEQFVFADGEKQFRRWTLTRIDDLHYRGRADDVIGEAVGELAGNALRWSYTLRLPVDGSSYDIAFDDWMFLQDEQRLFNKARMSKFGIDVGEITLFFEKQVEAK
ncbi:DUF3833 domain-containing protein [Permianibacter sp. IMCC34836]|uniref:DUF3833 domain-containing protein n=1 Tax=Permianibacter fluminis TaxID=2738515 RepID=UPI0015548EF1|nr:DUF3833 domain-containing protein [Permianibacter fluminis]NQD36859.1 DUF3833 domain-containing protein [Permianibacter fluminis]